MDLKSAKKILGEMFDLASQIDDDILSETTQAIYNDVQAHKTLEQVITSARELMVFVNEVPEDDFIYEIKLEMEELLNTLLEDE